MLTRAPFYDLAEELGSDEDDIDEDGQEYLEILVPVEIAFNS